MKRDKKREKSPLLLGVYTQERVQRKQQLQKAGTAELYQVSVNHFLRFVGNPGFRLAELNRTLVTDFVTYLQNKGLATNSINTYLSNLRAIYNAALQEERIAGGAYPFQRLKLRRETTPKRAVSVATLRRLGQLKPGDSARELAVDLCLFSFLACGMPFVDMAYLTERNIHQNELVYNRHKTGTPIRLEITTGMWQLIRKYAPRRGAQGYLFPILAAKSPTYNQYKACLAAHNRLLKQLGKELHLAEKFTSYVVRHTWASAALQSHVPVAVISQALGHTSEKTTRCYLSELDISELIRANRKVSGMINDLVIKKWEKSPPYL